jgi:CheY-like chemotaxis protein
MLETFTKLKANSDTASTERRIARTHGPSPFPKKALIVDDDTDITLAFKVGFDSYYYEEKTRIEVYTYNDPSIALSEFKPNFYDLLLTDINMPYMNGFDSLNVLSKRTSIIAPNGANSPMH